MLQWVWGGVFLHPGLQVKYDLGTILILVPILSSTAYFLGFLHLLGVRNRAFRVLLSLLLAVVFLGLSYVVAFIVVFTCLIIFVH